MNRKLSDLASVAEIIAAIGVILSLLFVGFEIRDGNQETRAVTVQATLDSEMAFQSELLRYADIWEKVARGESLSDGEEVRRGTILYNMMMTLNEDRIRIATTKAGMGSVSNASHACGNWASWTKVSVPPIASGSFRGPVNSSPPCV